MRRTRTLSREQGGDGVRQFGTRGHFHPISVADMCNKQETECNRRLSPVSDVWIKLCVTLHLQCSIWPWRNLAECHQKRIMKRTVLGSPEEVILSLPALPFRPFVLMCRRWKAGRHFVRLGSILTRSALQR